MVKIYLLHFVNCIACFPVNHAYVFMGKIFVEVSLPTKITNFSYNHNNYVLYQECMHPGIIDGIDMIIGDLSSAHVSYVLCLLCL